MDGSALSDDEQTGSQFLRGRSSSSLMVDDELSDDGALAPALKRPQRPLQHRPDNGRHRQVVTRLVAMKCRCSRVAKRPRLSCYKLFAGRVQEIVDLRKKIRRLHKLDADRLDSLLQIQTPCLYRP